MINIGGSGSKCILVIEGSADAYLFASPGLLDYLSFDRDQISGIVGYTMVWFSLLFWLQRVK